MREKLTFLICVHYEKEFQESKIVRAVHDKLLRFKSHCKLELIIMSYMHEQQRQLFLTPSNQVKRDNYEIVDDFLDQYIEIIKSWESSGAIEVFKYACNGDFYDAIVQCKKEHDHIGSLFFSYNRNNIENNYYFIDIINKMYKKFDFPIIIIPDMLTERKLNFLL